MNQYFDTQNSAIIASNNKKLKPNTQNETYLGHPIFRNPNPNPNSNPKPNQIPFARPLDLNQKPSYPHSSSQMTFQQRKPNPPGPRKPKLVNLSNVGKLRKMLMSCQPGLMVSLPQQGLVHCLIMNAKWDNLVFYRGQNFHTYIMGEFYGNLITTSNNGIIEIDTLVHDRHIHVDVNVLCKALRIDPNAFPQPCINVYESFKFNKDEFEKFLKMFCGSEVPPSLCEQNCGISFNHFLPKYQQLAYIIRANILPKPLMDKYFDFVDLKIMYQMVTNTVEFNIIYVIILHMFLAFQLDFMPYGLLLTSIFEMYHISMPRSYVEKAEYCYVEDLVVPQIPLSEFKSFKSTFLGKAKVEESNDVTKENEILRKVFKDLGVKIVDNNTKIRGLEDENIEINFRLAIIENKLGFPKESESTEVVDLNQVVDEKQLVDVNVTTGFEHLPDLGEFDPTLGFVAAVEKVINE